MAALALLVAFATPADAQLVDYGGAGTDGYKYIVVASDENNPGLAGFELLPCDDTWLDGVSAWYGEILGCGTPEFPNCLPDLCSAYADAETAWDPSESDLLVCYTLEVCEGGSIDAVALRLDNDALVWVNGVAGTVTSGIGVNGDFLAPFCGGTSADGLCETEGCPDGEGGPGAATVGGFDKVVFTNPAWVTGATNTIAIRARDREQIAFLDVRIDGTQGTCGEVCVGDDDDDDDDDDEIKDE
jgi:hypothetical protein